MIRDHEEALAAWSDRCKLRNLSPKTVSRELPVIRRFLSSLGRKPVARATKDDVRSFLAEAEKTARLSLRSYLSTLRCFFFTVIPEGALPTDGLTIKHTGTRAQLVLSRETVTKILAKSLDAAARGKGFRRLRRAFALRDRALVEILYGVGVRAAEVRAAKLLDLDLDGKAILVRRAKGGESRFLPLPSAAIPHLRRYVKEGRPRLVQHGRDDKGALFLNLHGRPLVQVAGIISKLAKLTGTKASPHAFRRSVGTHLVRDGVPVPAVQLLFGHEDLGTTARYVQIERRDLRQAVELLERGRRGG